MVLHFSSEEFSARQTRCCRALRERDLDGVLMFKQESMYYLTGYDTSGYLYFQTLLMTADGKLSLLTRSGDLASAQLTSVIDDIRIWVDHADANPAHEIRDLLISHGLSGKRIGIEYHAVGLSARRGRQLDAALEGSCCVVDASDLVAQLRQLKSPAELTYVRRSAELTEGVLQIANRLTVPGASLGEIRAAMTASSLSGGGDPSGVRWILGCGETALIVRYFTGSSDQTVAANDQVTHEFGVPYRHYYTALMHVVLTGKPDPRHRSMFSACRDALEACEGALRPGNTLGAAYDAYARSFTNARFENQFLNACGYPLAATYPPTWVEEPLIYRDNPLVLAPGMVFFLYMCVRDAKDPIAMSLGETVLMTANGCERLTRAPRKLIVN